MKFKVGDRVLSNGSGQGTISACDTNSLPGCPGYTIKWDADPTHAGVFHSASYADSKFVLVEDKSGWTYRQWFDAGYELRLSSSTVAKKEDGIYAEEFHDDTRYDWGPGHLGMVPELSLHYLMERGQPAHKDIGPLPCSCTSRDLLICGCKCGGI